MAEMKGAAELQRFLLNLPYQTEKKVLRKSAISGARVIRNAIQSAAPVAAKPINRRGGVVTKPGTLKRAVVLKFAPEKSSVGSQSYVVVVRHGKRYQKSSTDAFYWLWVEQGHKYVARGSSKLSDRRKASGGAGSKSVPAHPFFVASYRASFSQAQAKMLATAEKSMTDIIKGA